MIIDYYESVLSPLKRRQRRSAVGQQKAVAVQIKAEASKRSMMRMRAGVFQVNDMFLRDPQLEAIAQHSMWDSGTWDVRLCIQMHSPSRLSLEGMGRQERR